MGLIDSILNSSLFDPKTLIQYLVSHGYYPLLKQATEKIVSIKGTLPYSILITFMQTPENKKTSASLPLITPLYLFPFKIVKDDPELYQTCFIQTFLHILVIPLLPYRLPVQSLAQLSASIPFYDIHLLSSSLNEFLELPLQDRLHLLSNLATFIPPRYKLLPLKSLATYLQILSKLMVDLPITAFEEPASPNARKQFSGQESDDSEDEDDAQQDAKSSLQSPVQKYSIDIDGHAIADGDVETDVRPIGGGAVDLGPVDRALGPDRVGVRASVSLSLDVQRLSGGAVRDLQFMGVSITKCSASAIRAVDQDLDHPRHVNLA